MLKSWAPKGGSLFLGVLEISLLNVLMRGPAKQEFHWVDETGEWHKDVEIDTDWQTSFTNCSQAFIEGIRNNQKNIQMDPATARYILQIDLAVISSVRQNFKEIKLKDVKDGPTISIPDSDSEDESNQEGKKCLENHRNLNNSFF